MTTFDMILTRKTLKKQTFQTFGGILAELFCEKKMFHEISENLQEKYLPWTPCFSKLASLGLQLYLRNDSHRCFQGLPTCWQLFLSYFISRSNSFTHLRQ